MITPGVKTLDDVLQEIRTLIQDNDSTGYRYADDEVIRKINTALLEIRKLRPDAFVANFTQGVLTNNPVPAFETTDIGLAVAWPLDINHFYSPVIFYVAGILEMSDDEFADDSRAAIVLQSFQQQLIGPGAK